MPASKHKKRGHKSKSKRMKNRLQTSRGDPLVPIASPYLESQGLEPQSRKDDQDIPNDSSCWRNNEPRLNSLVDRFDFEDFGFEPRLVKPISTDNAGSYLVEYEGRYYLANLIIYSLHRFDDPEDLGSILSVLNRNKVQNIGMTKIMELDDTDD